MEPAVGDSIKNNVDTSVEPRCNFVGVGDLIRNPTGFVLGTSVMKIMRVHTPLLLKVLELRKGL